MASLLRQCPGTAGKVCNCFLPTRDKDPHFLCTSCSVKECNDDDFCTDCHDWGDTMWQRVIILPNSQFRGRGRLRLLLPLFLSRDFLPLCLSLYVIFLHHLIMQ